MSQRAPIQNSGLPGYPRLKLFLMAQPTSLPRSSDPMKTLWTCNLPHRTGERKRNLRK